MKSKPFLNYLLYLIILAIIVYIAVILIFNETKQSVNKVKGYKYLIGLSLYDAKTPRNAYLINTANDNASNQNDLNILIREAQNTVEQQIKDIVTLEGYGIDILVISPIDDEMVKQKLVQVSKKIPVIILENNTFEEFGDAFIGYDDVKAGELIAQKILEDDLMDKGLMILTGPENDNVSKRRLYGLTKELMGKNSKSPSMLESNWNRNDAETRMKYYVVSGKKAGIVVALNDQMAYGAYLGASKLRETEIAFFGINGFFGENEGRDLVNRNILKGTVAFSDMYEAIVKMSLNILEKKDYEKKVILNATYIGE